MITTQFTRRVLAFSCLFIAALFSAAQEEDINLGYVTNEELLLKECAFDKSADAVILLDKGVSYFDDQFELMTDRRIRLKILKEKGVERGNIRIVFYSAEEFERITDIEAVVITPEEGGGTVTRVLEKKNIFIKKLNRLYSQVSFALPNVKVGSIIDYKYQSRMRSYAGLKNWEFQGELPVVTSSYQLMPIPNSEFAYTVYKKPELPISIKPDNDAGKILFEMHNVPGLRNEVYSTTTKDYLQRVNFQFAAYKNYYGRRSFTSTWEELAKELLNEGSFGSQINKNLSSTPFLKALAPSLTPEEKIQAIYEFVRTNIVWDDIYSKYSEAGVKNVLEKKKGNSADINLLLVNLLKTAGLEAYPLLVSERHHGKVDTTYSYLDQFNKVVAYVLVNNTSYVLDGTTQFTPYYMVPPGLLNATGFLVDKKKAGFVRFNNLPHKQKETILIRGIVKEDGSFDGNATITKSEYAKLYNEQRYKADKASYIDRMLKPHSFVKLDSFAVEGAGIDSTALVHQLKFHYNLKKTGSYYLLNYNLFTGFDENPFTTQHRFADIDFGTKYHAILLGSFALPASLVTQTIPANKTLISLDKSLSISRAMELKGNQLNIRFVIATNRESYEATEYEMIREFYKQMIALMNEPILLKAN
jgi:hypothetical protein